MKRNRTRALILSLICLIGVIAASAQTQTNTLEYWIDNHFKERISLPVNGSVEQIIDVSRLCTGIHTIEMRVSDTNGRWGAPLIRHFLKGDTRLTGNGLSTYSYCVDGNWNDAVTGNLSTEQTIDIDITSLCEGIHTLQMHITDLHGQHSQTLLHHFLVMGKDVTKRELTTYRYWVDDFNQMNEGKTGDGQIALNLDVSRLSKGIHTLCYQVADNTGLMSAPRMLYFLIPDLEEGSDRIVAYEYWFNHGPRKRVELTPTTSISESGLMIEVKDVEPLRIPDDYVFHAAEETVSLNDDVFFGMQVFSGADRGSLAVLSDTVKADMTVDPHFLDLHDGDSIGFNAPHVGKMQGWKTVCQSSDSLTYRLSPTDVKADFYNGQGKRLMATKTTDVDGRTVYGVKPDDGTCYLLLYDTSMVFEHIGIQLESTNTEESGMAQLTTGLRISVRKHQLIIQSQEDTSVKITNLSGSSIYHGKISAGTTVIQVSSGVCIVKAGANQNIKMMIP